MTHEPMSRLDLWYYKAARDKRRSKMLDILRDMVREADDGDGYVHMWVGEEPDDPDRVTCIVHRDDLEHFIDMASTGKGIVDAAERGARRGARRR